MKFGANTFIFRSPFSTDTDLDLIPKLKGMGFDLIEVAVEDPALVDVPSLKRELEKHELGIVTCGAFGPGRFGRPAGCPSLCLLFCRPASRGNPFFGRLLGR